MAGVDDTVDVAAEGSPTPSLLVDAPEAKESADADGESGRTASSEPIRAVYRLRDLDRRGRWVAAIFALALCLMPLISFAQTAPDWIPFGDPALMAFRALDVGTDRTTLVGQPSTSAVYVEDVPVVTHPGPLHFYLLALPVRLLGAAYGMLVVSLFITAGSVLLAAWAAFRQLGPPGGVVAAVVLGAITFTTGAASLMHPVSSNIAGYPVLCSMVLLWCLLSGDLRLLPLATLVVSFAAQQHLSSVPALLVAVGMVGLVMAWRERHLGRRLQDPVARGRLIRWVGGSVAIALVLWSPVLLQQFFGKQGNLSALVEFTRHDDRPTVGYESALRPLAHVLGVPPWLGRLEPTGFWLLDEVSAARWVSAAIVLAAVVVVGVRVRRSSPPRAALAAMALILVVAGLYNGASVPVGLEMGRVTFYHWTWPLTFFVMLGLGLAVLGWLQRTNLAGWRWVRPAALSACVVAIAVPAMVNPSLDRRSNNLALTGAPVEREYVEELADEILVHQDELGDQTVVLERGDILFQGFGAGLTLELVERGVDVRFQPVLGRAVHPDRMVDRDTLDSGLVLAVGEVTPYPNELPGQHVAETVTTAYDREAWSGLVDRLESADEMVLGGDLEQAIDDLPEPFPAIIRQQFMELAGNAREVLGTDLNMLRLLRDHPLEQPSLDPALLDRLIDSVLRQEPGYHLDVYLMDRDEILDFGNRGDIG